MPETRRKENNNELPLILECILFSAGRPLSISTLSKKLGLTPKLLRQAIAKLQQLYQERLTALEVIRIGNNKYVLQVKSEYINYAELFTQREIPDHLLKTMALIAYYQPLKQPDLVKMIGSRAYNHIRELESYGLINVKRIARTKVLTLSHKFAEYFGLKTLNHNQIKRWLEAKVGILSATVTAEKS